MKYSNKIDLHMHTTFSDGTETPEEVLERVRELGLEIFSVTDHDATGGCEVINGFLRKGDPVFINGVEFSCRDDLGKYHILGYGYDPKAPAIRKVLDHGHSLRVIRLNGRLEFLKTKFGFDFPKEDIDWIVNLKNPGKPHLAQLMVKHGMARDKDDAIENYIDMKKFKLVHVSPEEAIEGILQSGGIPVLAHPVYGDGNQYIRGSELSERILRLKAFGLKGVEAFYSEFTDDIIEELLGYAKKYGLYVTAGSDYHGTNKSVMLGDMGLSRHEMPKEMVGFLDDVLETRRR